MALLYPERAMFEVGQRTILVTGASAGLGLEIARRLYDATDHRLILTARESSLSRFASAGIVPSDRVWLRPLDVTRAKQRRAVVREADALGGVDILINNAGIAYRAVLEHVSEREWLSQMQVNFVGPMELAREVLPGMRARRFGRIVNVSSVGGMMAMPTMGIYSASKFALEGAAEAMSYEVRPWGIYVSLVQPGFIRSRVFENVRFTGQSERSRDDPRDPYHAHYASMGGFIARLMLRAFSDHEQVARVVVHTALRRKPPLRVAGTLDARLFGVLRRLLPRRLYHEVLYRALPGIRGWGPRALP
jgi:NAD(P)-dependent dehydrogenase (short-subunit alcohol dehydrogenase family)